MADPQAAAAAVPSEWIRVYHAAHKRHYYFNTVTESSQWVRPKGVVVADAAPDVQERADRAVSAAAAGAQGGADGSTTSGPVVTGPAAGSAEAAAGSGARAAGAGAGAGSGVSSPQRPTKPRKRGIRKLQSIAKGVANILGIRKRKAGKGDPEAMTANPLSPVAAAAAADGAAPSPAAAGAAAGSSSPATGAPGGASNGHAAADAGAGAAAAASAPGPSAAPSAGAAAAGAAPKPAAAAAGEAAAPGGLKRTMSAGEMKPELRRVRSILKRSSTMHVKREEDRRISFADQNGHNLENVVYCDNLHYSQQPTPSGALQPEAEQEEEDGGCAVM